jgi:hypothetical protein
MMYTTPDKWVVVKISSAEGMIYKVLGSWYGGFAYGNSWRMNSGICKVEQQDGDYLFHGYSGSCYRTHPNNYGMHLESSGILKQLQQSPDHTVELMPADTDWTTIIEEKA